MGEKPNIKEKGKTLKWGEEKWVKIWKKKTYVKLFLHPYFIVDFGS
jgi:hypothetical protein